MAKTTIRLRPNGPILIEGELEIFDEAGRPLPIDRLPVALCRCGASGRYPFCDGSHKRREPG